MATWPLRQHMLVRFLPPLPDELAVSRAQAVECIEQTTGFAAANHFCLRTGGDLYQRTMVGSIRTW
jgi:hypothetical protein